MRSLRIHALLLVVLMINATLLAHTVPAAEMKPSEGWTLHVDAKQHFRSKPDLIAHHHCKLVSDGLTECLLFDSDRPDAKIVGVEVIVSPGTYKTFSADEQAL